MSSPAQVKTWTAWNEVNPALWFGSSEAQFLLPIYAGEGIDAYGHYEQRMDIDDTLGKDELCIFKIPNWTYSSSHDTNQHHVLYLTWITPNQKKSNYYFVTICRLEALFFLLEITGKKLNMYVW